MSNQMDVLTMEAEIKAQMDPSPLLSASSVSIDHEHVINMMTDHGRSPRSSTGGQPSVPNESHHEDRFSRSSDHPLHLPSSFQWSRMFANFNGIGPRRGFDPNEFAGLSLSCLDLEWAVTTIQISLSLLVLFEARGDDVPPALFIWLASYAVCCGAIFLFFFWRIQNNNLGMEQFHQARQDTSGSDPPESVAYNPIPATQNSDEVNHPDTMTRSMRLRGKLSILFNKLMDHIKRAVDFLFACWFIIAYTWRSIIASPPFEDAGRSGILVLFVAFSCIMSGIPVAFYGIKYICMHLVDLVIRVRDNSTRSRGSTWGNINSLSRYKFKKVLLENGDQYVLGTSEAGIFIGGTGKRHSIIEENSVCCLCSTRYGDDDELTKLPCFHTFHFECVNKWLEMNAICPLCKSEVMKSSRVFCCGGFRLFY